MGIILNNKEKVFFDNRNYEVMQLATTEDPILWKLAVNIPSMHNSVSGGVDCLYEEPIMVSSTMPKMNIYLPYKIYMIYEQKDRSNEVDDTGRIERVDGRVYFSRLDCEKRKIPLNDDHEHISVGDIIQFWSKNKLRTWYFEIMNINRDGWQNDSDNFTQYLCDIVRNESFEPERKLMR